MSGRITGNPPPLNARAIQALKAASPTPQQIHENMAALNEEVEEQASAMGVDLAVDYVPLEESEPAMDDIDIINARLDAQIEARRLKEEAEAAEAPSAPPAEAPAEMTIEDQVRQMLSECKDSPSDRQIAAWKQQFGESGVQVLAMGKGDVYVFTYLTRGSFQKIQSTMAKAASIDGLNTDPEQFMMEQVIKQCILWPRPLGVEFFYQSRSGVIPTLYSSIMLNSYHLSPQQAMVLTAQL